MAGIELATAYVSLVVSGEKVAPGVKKSLAGVEGEAARAGTRSGKAYGESMTKGVGASAKRLATTMGAAFAGVAVASVFRDSISAASDLAETMNKTTVVFGDSAAGVVEWSKTSATSLGLSQQAALAVTSQFGDLFEQLGQGAGQAAKTSKSVVQLATDLGSFHNVGTGEVLDRIAGAMRGEYDAIQKIIPGLSDARVKQEALRASGKTSATQLTEQEKAMAALAIITKDGSAANADFAETSGGLANQQKILSAQLDDTKAKLGGAFLPAVTNVVKAMNDAIPAVVATSKAVGALPGPVKAAAAAWVIYAAAQKLGITGVAAGGFAKVGDAMTGLRIRTMLAADGFKLARDGQLQLQNGSGKLIAPVGRSAAAMQALGSASVGAGNAMRRGLGGVVGMLGGPWGLAFIAAATIATAFISKQKKEKAAVDDLAASLNQQTGAVEAAGKAKIIDNLESAHALKAAKALGIGYDTLVSAVMGNEQDTAKVTAAVAANLGVYNANLKGGSEAAVGFTKEQVAMGEAAHILDKTVGSQTSTLSKSVAETKRKADANKALLPTEQGTATLVENSAAAMKLHAAALAADAAEAKKAADALQKFLDKLDAQRARALQASGGMIAYEASIDAAAASLKENGRTLDIGTEKGRANQSALDDIAGAWNNLTTHQQNAKGAFKETRDALIKQAEKFGDTEKEAKAYADRVLEIPRKVSTKVHLDDAEAKARLKALREATRDRKMKITVQYEQTGRLPGQHGMVFAGDRNRAGGGPVTAGRPYVVGEHRRELFIPAQSGRIEPSVPAARAAGNTYNTTVVADDPWKWKRDMDHMARAEAMGGADFR